MDLVLKLRRVPELENLQKTFFSNAQVSPREDTITMPGVVAKRWEDNYHNWNLGPANKDDPTVLANQDGKTYQSDGIFLPGLTGEEGIKEVKTALSLLALKVHISKEMLVNTLHKVEAQQIKFAGIGGPPDFEIDSNSPLDEPWELDCTNECT